MIRSFIMYFNGIRFVRRVAEKLHLSIKTIETYRAHIKDKVNLANAADLPYYAIQ
jgi:DNA-binding NarL/FixJ family response regulator